MLEWYKKHIRLRLLLLAYSVLPSISLAADWTGYGTITELSQQPATSIVDVAVIGDFAVNPSTCTKKMYSTLK